MLPSCCDHDSSLTYLCLVIPPDKCSLAQLYLSIDCTLWLLSKLQPCSHSERCTRTVVRPTRVYGAETWRLKKEVLKKNGGRRNANATMEVQSYEGGHDKK